MIAIVFNDLPMYEEKIGLIVVEITEYGSVRVG